MSYNIGSQEDYENLFDDIQTMINSNRIGKDAYATFELGDTVSEYMSKNWNNLSSADHSKLDYYVANAIARTEANFNPAEFKHQQETIGFPAGETLHRNTESIKMNLHDTDKSGDVVSKIYDMSDAIADRTLSVSEWSRFKNQKLNEEMMKDSGYDDEIETRLARERIYERHNIDPNTPDRDLPYYVSKDMEDAGVKLDF